MAENGVMRFLQQLRDYERSGVPKNAGTNTVEGFDLSRMHRLVHNLGDPLAQFKVVHVAGTKGKGSTVAFLSGILRAAGYSVGTYTSPHLRSIRERIAIGKSVSEKAFENLYQSVCRPLHDTITAENFKLTHFEVLTALAFCYFAQEKVDIAVIETGLGGARDATNVISSKGLAASVIVSIGEEHLEALGGSLESIALAKAGIIKQNRPVIVSRQANNSMVEKIIQEQASMKNASIIHASGAHIHGSIKAFHNAIGECYQVCDFMDFQLHNCKMRMFGNHQIDNALTAICTALSLREEGWHIPDSAVQSGIEQTFIPGRFHILSHQLALLLGFKEAKVVLDGAHTSGSAAALASTLKSVFPREAVTLVIAMAVDKDHHEFATAFLNELRPACVIATRVSIAGSETRSAQEESVLKAWIKEDKPEFNVESFDSLQNAIVVVKEHKGVICFTGSLHLVSAILDIIKYEI